MISVNLLSMVKNYCKDKNSEKMLIKRYDMNILKSFNFVFEIAFGSTC